VLQGASHNDEGEEVKMVEECFSCDFCGSNSLNLMNATPNQKMWLCSDCNAMTVRNSHSCNDDPYDDELFDIDEFED
jgi:transcription elongation factor Elf1